jgi:hypothetical protein
MKGRSKKFTAAIVVAALAAVAVPTAVVASIITGATAVGVNVTANLKPNSNAVLSGTTGPLTGLVTTCTASSTGFQLTTSGGGLGPFTITNPSFTGCSDNLGGTDTITSNSTNGPWTATYVNSTGAPNPDKIKLGIPKAGQTLVSSVAPSCTLTIFPAGAGSINGNYDNAGNLRINNQTIKYTAAGVCPTGTGSGNASFSTSLNSTGTGAPGYKVTPPIFGVS